MVGDQEPGDEPEVDIDEAQPSDAPVVDDEPAIAADAEPADIDDEPADADADAEPTDGDDEPADEVELADLEPADAELAAAADADGDQPSDDEPADLEPIIVEPWQPPVRRHRWLARLVGVAALAVPTIVVGTVALRATGLDPASTVDERLEDALRYDGDGNPLVRSPQVDVGTVQRRQWRVCGKACDKVSGRGEEFRPGEVLAGSRVQVRVIGTSGEATIETPGWDGTLKALRRPVLIGSPRIGSTVEAAAGKWTGGWLGGDTLTGVRACPTRQGGGRCIAFTVSVLGKSDTSKRTIPAAFRGWWIGAIEWHVPPSRTFTADAPSDPARPEFGLRAPTPGATVKVGPLQGPVR